MGVVRSDGGDPGTPQQGEEPRCINSVEVYTQVPGCIVPGQGTEVDQLPPAALQYGAGEAPSDSLSPSQPPQEEVVSAHRQAQLGPVFPNLLLNPVCPGSLCVRWRVELGDTQSLPPRGHLGWHRAGT